MRNIDQAAGHTWAMRSLTPTIEQAQRRHIQLFERLFEDTSSNSAVSNDASALLSSRPSITASAC